MKYSAVWSETEWIVNISEKDWIQICFKNNWKIIDAKLKHKFYLMSVNKCVVINEIFDKLHNQKKNIEFRIQHFIHVQYLWHDELYIKMKNSFKKWAVIDL